MTVEDTYRCLCGNTQIRVVEQLTNKTLYKGDPDHIPLAVMFMDVIELKPMRADMLKVYV